MKITSTFYLTVKKSKILDISEQLHVIKSMNDPNKQISNHHLEFPTIFLKSHVTFKSPHMYKFPLFKRIFSYKDFNTFNNLIY